VLDREKVIVAFEQKRAAFQEYLDSQQQQRRLLRDWLEQFHRLDAQTLLAKLAELDVAWPGALPTPELDRADRLRVPFPVQWNNHADARQWALSVLEGRPVAAVDGSQITPTKDLSIPIGAVQVGWFVNDHQPGGSYVKDVAFEVLAPNELAPAEGDAPDERGFPDWRVNQLRFVRECEMLCDLMARSAAASEMARPLCFFDGSFIISFAGQMRPERARPYLRAVEATLACSEHCRVPLVGFVDSSYSRDLVRLVESVTGHAVGVDMTDGALLAPLLPGWGDRSPVFLCARSDALSEEGHADFYREVAFVYVRLTQDRPPARVEMPAWLVADNRVDDVLDLVRAECVVGAGYPYAVETADAVAVISQQDRQRFYALFEQFAQAQQLSLVQSRKARSKESRR
jgi:hypothetical protein